MWEANLTINPYWILIRFTLSYFYLEQDENINGWYFLQVTFKVVLGETLLFILQATLQLTLQIPKLSQPNGWLWSFQATEVRVSQSEWEGKEEC